MEHNVQDGSLRAGSVSPRTAIAAGVFGVAFLLAVHMVGAAGQTVNIPTQVVVGNASPVVSAVTLNGGAAITLTAATTTVIQVGATVTDSNGCSDITSGTSTILVYRSGIGSSTCDGTQSDRNCYKATAFTSTSSCISSTQLNTTTTFAIWYFADATDASSSAFSAQNWRATVISKDGTGATSTADSSAVELNTLVAIDVATSSINFGTLGAGSDTGATNQNATTTNAGNSSTTLQLSALSTLVSGSNFIPTTSQRYATSTFTFPGSSVQLTGTAATVSGFSLTTPTSTTNISRGTYWGVSIPGGTATGTYNGTTEFRALWIP